MKKNSKNTKTESKSTQATTDQKLIEGSILIMDLNALPHKVGMDADTWARHIRQNGVLFYDSEAGEKPTLMPENEAIKIYDVADEKLMKEIGAILNEDMSEEECKEVMNPYTEPEVVNEIVANGTTPSVTGRMTVFGTEGETYIAGIDPYRTVPVVSTPLTDNEVEQLEIQDPRGQGISNLEVEERAWIDQVMLEQNHNTSRISQGVNLIDDTDD